MRSTIKSLLLFLAACMVEPLPPPPVVYVPDMMDEEGSEQKADLPDDPRSETFIIPIRVHTKSNYQSWDANRVLDILSYVDNLFLDYGISFALQEIIVDEYYSEDFVTNETKEYFDYYEGPIDIFLVASVFDNKSNKYYSGWSSNVILDCPKFISLVYVYGAELFAHELGHALALNHSDDENNFMYPKTTFNSYITEEQGERARIEARWFTRTCIN